MVKKNNVNSIDLDSIYTEIKIKLEALDLRLEALEEAKYNESKK